MSPVRAGSIFTATVCRKLRVIRAARVFAKLCDGTLTCGAAATARSAQSAVATTITAITWRVRRIVYFKIGQSIEMPSPAVKETFSITAPQAPQFARLSRSRLNYVDFIIVGSMLFR